ncbi:tRNA (adenosine(37)-N6)-threonylcarbamoyltransferase complex ATPase subunit type 1 TsaE [Chloroflexota bacterium]
MKKYVFFSNSPASTLSLGRRLGRKLKAGSVIALIGELGCGKTLLTRGICSGLDIPARQVNSPTFVLVNEYSGRLPVYHMDVYRIGGTVDAFEIGLLDYLARAKVGVMIVEWAEKILSLLPEDRLQVDFTVLGANKRRIAFSGTGGKYGYLFKELKL